MLLRIETRFSSLPRWTARAVLACLLALTAYGLFGAPLKLPPTTKMRAGEEAYGDGSLYLAVVRRMDRGEGYYTAAFAEHRAHGYPLFPYVTVRMPTLALIRHGLGTENADLLLEILAVAAVVAFALRIHAWSPTPLALGSAAALAAFGIASAASHPLYHDPWSAVLMFAAVAVRTRRTWLVSVAFALAAVLVRELTFPFLLVMIVVAWRDGQRREVVGWVAATLIAIAAFVGHAMIVDSMRVPGDLHSAGWLAIGGWPFVLTAVRECTAFIVFPLWICALLFPLALLGWVGWKHPTGESGTLFLAGFTLAYTVIGRPNNYYWGIHIGTLLPIGLMFAPAALRALWHRAWSGAATADFAVRAD